MLIDQQLREVAEKLCEGSLTPLLMHLAGRTRLSDEDRRMLQDMIDNA